MFYVVDLRFHESALFASVSSDNFPTGRVFDSFDLSAVSLKTGCE